MTVAPGCISGSGATMDEDRGTTALGRAVREGHTTGARRSKQPPEHPREFNWLRDVILGGHVYSSLTLLGDWRRNGVKMVLIDLGAATVGFAVGRVFHTIGA